MSAPPPAIEIAALRARADALLQIGRGREAVPLLQSALRLAPDDPRLHCRMAQAFLGLGERRRALESAERAIAAAPDDEWGHRLRSIILIKGKNPRQALRSAEEAAALAPHSVHALSALVKALLRVGKLEAAQGAAVRLRRVAPRSSVAHEALALVALRRRSWLEAEIHCRAMLHVNPESYAAFHNLGVALRFSKRTPEAVAAFLEARRLNPADPLTRRSLNETTRPYLFEMITPPLACAVGAAALALVPTEVGVGFGPLWPYHRLLLLVSSALIGAAFLLGRRRWHTLPPGARACFPLISRLFVPGTLRRNAPDDH